MAINNENRDDKMNEKDKEIIQVNNITNFIVINNENVITKLNTIIITNNNENVINVI